MGEDFRKVGGAARAGRHAAWAVASMLALAACARPAADASEARESVREGRNLRTPSDGLVPGQWPRGF